MENELRLILCTAMSPRRCKRLTGVKLALPKRDPFRKPPSFGSLLSADLKRAAAAVSAFQLKWIPSQMAARLYTLVPVDSQGPYQRALNSVSCLVLLPAGQ